MREICRNCNYREECENYAHTKQDEWVCNNFKPNDNGIEQISLFDEVEENNQ